MAGPSPVGATWRDRLARHWIIALLAVAFFLAALVDPGQWWEATCLAVAALFVAWSVQPAMLPVLAAAAPVLTAVALWGGGYEPGVFLLSLLALVVTAWFPQRIAAYAVVAVCMAVPIVVDVFSPIAHLAWGLWLIGIGFPAVLGMTIRRLEQVSAELARARDELTERAVLEERQRIARDVHDLVGHGLAAVLLHVAGARHVLRRDPDAADEALRTAQEVGRASMQELRSTVGRLRDDAVAPDAPAPGVAQIADLATTYATAGIPVAATVTGDNPVPPAVGLAAYRIVQQALANAAQHAPDAATTVSVEITGTAVQIAVDTAGAVPGSFRPGHGIASMQERARVAGGRLTAGPLAAGWAVRCVLPLNPDDGADEPDAGGTP